MSHLFQTAPRLEDDRFLLTPLQASEFDALHEAASDPLIWAGHPSKDRGQRDKFQALFDTFLITGGTEVIREKATGRVIGCSRFYEAQSIPGGCAIGFTFLVCDFWGTGSNRVIKDLMLAAAFEEFDHVYLEIASANIRSQKAAAKIGAVFHSEVPGIFGGDVPYQIWALER